MTAPTTTKFGDFLIKVGDGGAPEVFSAPCGLTSKSFNQTASAQETVVPDCDDPDAPANVQRTVDSLSRDLSGSGVLAKEAFDDVWQPWYTSGLSKNCQVYPNGAAGGYYQGAFLLTTLSMTANRGQRVNVSVTMQSDGDVPWTPGS